MARGIIPRGIYSSGGVRPGLAVSTRDIIRLDNFIISIHQAEFDKIWPYLRVMARSSPEDKLTLANGLNKSLLYHDKKRVAELKAEGITIFPDRQARGEIAPIAPRSRRDRAEIAPRSCRDRAEIAAAARRSWR